MLTEICNEIHNYFADDTKKHRGNFEISGGAMQPLDFLQDGQYFRIVGSVFNDGVYQYPGADLTDEVFTGGVWAMSPEPAFIKVCEKIKAYSERSPRDKLKFVSESFSGYSYQRLVGKDGLPPHWSEVFAPDLRKWRKPKI